MTRETKSAISHPVAVSTLPAKGFGLRIETTDAQRAALAEEHDLLEVTAFSADIDIRRWRKDGARISGEINAQVVQNCVVTLEPVPTVMNVPFDAVFLPEESKLNRPLDEEGALLIDPEGPDAPEVFTGGTIDVGAVAEEFFELAIDPYPRSPDAGEVQADAGASGEDDGAENPFASLSALRDKL